MGQIAQWLLPEFEQECATTRKFLERYPEDKPDWRPHPKSMPMNRLAAHVAEIPGWTTMMLTQTLLELGPDFKGAVAEKTADLLATFDKNVESGMKTLAVTEDADFAVEWTMKVRGQQFLKLPRTVLMRTWVLNHIVHHRAQLGVYYRILEVQLPGTYGPSADAR